MFLYIKPGDPTNFPTIEEALYTSLLVCLIWIFVNLKFLSLLFLLQGNIDHLDTEILNDSNILQRLLLLLFFHLNQKRGRGRYFLSQPSFNPNPNLN